MDRLQHFGAFLRLFARTYYDDRCLRSAAALCFTTLLSLVPLAAVTLSVFVAVPVFETFATEVQRFIFENFVPASGTILQQQLTELTTKAAKMTGLGIAFLTLSALLLMDTIEGAINDIWHISAQRKALPRFMVYWAMLTLGPLLIGASLAGTSYLTALPLLSDAALLLEIKTRLLGLLPFLATTLACTLLYAVVPNTHVPLRNALSGAVMAAILFELAKKGFAFYITTFSQYETIYGALAAIPVFLIWLYISWAVVLLGAVLSYCLTHFSYLKATRQRSPLGQHLLHDFRSLGLIWQAQRTGHPPSAAMLLEHEQLLDEATLDEALTRLEAAQLIHQTEEEGWALSKDMSTLTLADLYRAQQLALPEIDPQWLEDDPWYQALHHVVTRTNRLTRAAQETPLQPLYQAGAETSRIKLHMQNNS